MWTTYTVKKGLASSRPPTASLCLADTMVVISLCPSGGQLGIQRIIYDVLQYQPAELRIFNSDFYTGERMFTPGWRPLDSFGPGSHINDLIAAHDLRADFLFAQALLRCGAVSAQGIAAQVLSMPVDEYLTTVEGASVLH